MKDYKRLMLKTYEPGLGLTMAGDDVVCCGTAQHKNMFNMIERLQQK